MPNFLYLNFVLSSFNKKTQVSDKKKSTIFLIICLLFSHLVLYPSSFSFSEDTIEKIPDLIETGAYREAIPLLDKLLEHDPHNTYYHYAMGVCLAASDTLYEHALYHLGRAKKQQFADDIDYHTGKLYFYNYMFEEAYTAFLNFQNNADWRTLREKNPEQYITSSRNAKNLVTETRIYELVTEKEIPVYELTDYYNMLRNQNLIMSGEDQISYLYYVRNTRQAGQDIFRMKNTTSFESRGESLGPVINTNEDESYPFFDVTSKTLYFSSKEHKNMGQFDLFLSQTDIHQDRWKVPENPGFPINTPHNEYFLIPQANGTLILASDRKNIPGKITLFTLRETPYVVNLDTVSVEGRKKISQFQYQACMQSRSFSRIKESIKTDESVSGDSLIRIALQNQLIIDSLLRVADQKEEAFYNSLYSKEKSELRRQIHQLTTTAQKLSESNRSVFDSAPIPESPDKKNENEQKQDQNDFEIKKSSVYSESNPFPLDIQLPDGIVYRIQLGAFSKDVPFSRFQGLYPITVESIEGSNISRYYAGMFQSYEACAEALRKVKNMGYSDAHIIAFLDGTRIRLQRAIEIEQYMNRAMTKK